MGKAKQRHRRAAEARRAAPQESAADWRWPALTGLRGLAAAMVLLFDVYVLAGRPAQVPAPFAWLASIGWSGADVFFTLSAFLLAMPFLRAQQAGAPAPALVDYWRHRGWRILPAYYVQVAILFALGLTGSQAEAWNAPDARSLAVNALFLYDLLPGRYPAVSVWWTLPVELGFYLLLPWSVRLLKPGRWPWLLLAILASLAWRLWILGLHLPQAQEFAWAEHLPGRLHQFLLGMVAAWLLVHHRRPFAGWSAGQRDAVAALALLAFLALPTLALPYTGHLYDGASAAQWPLLCWHLLASLLVGLLLVVLCAATSRASRVLAASGLRGLGEISYSLYLWHVPVLLAVRESLGGDAEVGDDFWTFAFSGVLFSLLAAGASWWLIERPAQRLGRRDKMAVPPARATT
jgi:peptidoglycan/LPS O-acetylase OafA/YrhL